MLVKFSGGWEVVVWRWFRPLEMASEAPKSGMLVTVRHRVE